MDIPFPEAKKQGIVVVSSIFYLRQMLGNLARGTVSIPLRHTQEQERLGRVGATEIVTPDDAYWAGLE